MNTKINQHIKNTFNKAKESYDDHCDLQRSIGNRLLDFLAPHVVATSRIMDLGCGTGIVTEKLISAFTYEDFHAIDFAEQMLTKAATRLASSNITLYSANFDTLPLSLPSFDLIFSNMALHWSSHFLSTLKMIISKLNHNGIIAFSIPLPGTLHELQPHFSINRFLPSYAITKALQKNAYTILINHEEEIILNFDNTLSALRSIKHVGATAVIKRSKLSYHSKSFLRKIQINKLTYYIGYFIARKRTEPCQ